MTESEKLQMIEDRIAALEPLTVEGNPRCQALSMRTGAQCLLAEHDGYVSHYLDAAKETT